MINVQTLFDRVNTDLARRDKAGYTSNDEYNRALEEAQQMLMEYYHALFERTKSIAESVQPFLKKENISISAGSASNPADYRHLIKVEYVLLENTGGEPTVEYFPMNQEKTNENRSSSAIRKPVQGIEDTYAFGFESGGIYVLPSTLSGKVRMTYLRAPTTATRAITYDAVNDLEVYDAGSSVQLEWPSQEQTNFVDILLWNKGLETRDSAVIQWVMGKKNFQQNFQ